MIFAVYCFMLLSFRAALDSNGMHQNQMFLSNRLLLGEGETHLVVSC